MSSFTVNLRFVSGCDLYIVFASPRRLDLRLLRPRRICVREMLGVWPAFPIAMWDFLGFTPEEDNIIAALEQHDRAFHKIATGKNSCILCGSHSRHRQNFHIVSHWRDEQAAPVLPDSFLGGSAPRSTVPRFGICFIPGLSLTEPASVCK
jgi:hypothetical protein